MKNISRLAILVFLFTGTLLTTFTSCQKYSDGPMLSFRSRTERVANTWKVDNYKVNGSDYTSLVAGYTETYSKDGTYSYAWGSLAETGKWVFQNKDAEIKITHTNSSSSTTLYILKLEEKQFWYYYYDGSDKKEFHLVEN